MAARGLLTDRSQMRFATFVLSPLMDLFTQGSWIRAASMSSVSSLLRSTAEAPVLWWRLP